MKAETESKIKVTYKGVVVGDYQADLLVADQVIVDSESPRSTSRPTKLNSSIN